MTTVTVPVRQAHIDAGVPRDPCRCVVALAIRDVLTALAPRFDAYEPVVYGNSVTLLANDDGEPYVLSLPAEARGPMLGFDNGYVVVPFEFDLELGR